MSPLFGKWYPVNTVLPQLEKSARGRQQIRVLVVTTESIVCEGRYEETFVQKKKVWKSCWGKNLQVTHWMPLPPPPEARQRFNTARIRIAKD